MPKSMIRVVAACIALIAISVFAFANDAKKTEDKSVPPVLNFKMKSLAGDEVNLSQYQGKVVLIVNTASKCGLTPQYEELEALYKKYADKGLVILGFPADNFNHQEPGDDKQISQFCTDKYGVTFPMFSKISVKGSDKADLYKLLTEAKTDPKFPGEIKWNFEKFLIGRNGQIANRFAPPIKPSSEQVVQAIEAELGK